MKKTLLSAVLIFAFALAQAQISGGIKGGLNFANVDTSGDPDGRTGYHAGLFFEAGLAGITLMPEVLYSTKGTDDLSLTYVEVPILLKKSFAKVLNVHLGPQFGILLSGDLDAGPLGDIDAKDELNSADLSIVIGGGIDLPGGISAGARYVYGLSDVNDKLSFGNEIPEISNRTFQVYIGYKLFGN